MKNKIKDDKNYWLNQIYTNNRYFVIIAFSTMMLEILMVFIYQLSRLPSLPEIDSKYLLYYFLAIALSGACCILFIAFKKNIYVLRIFHCIYLLSILFWSAFFAVFDVKQGNNSYVLAYILIFTSAGIRLPNKIHWFINFVMVAVFNIGIFTSDLEEKKLYNEAINIFILFILSCIIITYNNRIYFKQHIAANIIKEQNKKLVFLAEFDELTEIPNRRVICNFLDDCINQNIDCCCIVFDIDNFKNYNDTYGHLNGDKILKDIAETIYKCALESKGMAGRYGGEEFIMVIKDKNEDQIEVIVKNLLKEISLKKFKRNGKNLYEKRRNENGKYDSFCR